MNIIKKPYVYAVIFSVALISFSVYTLLDIFVIPHTISSAETNRNNSSLSSSDYSADSDLASDSSTLAGTNSACSLTDSGNITTTSTSYTDSNISITIETIRTNNTNVYVADLTLSDPSLLKTALANDTFGTNITAKTSVTAAANHAILAINGDYYGADSKGYVIKNGTIYRSTVRSDSNYDDLVIYKDGSLGIINERSISAEDLVADDVTQLFAFGPALVQNSSVCVTANSEVDKSSSSNPRTAIGIIDALHYIVVVSDGRTTASTGLSLYQLAGVMKDYGCTTAYNLDGGGSSTMYFNGTVINNPTTTGKSISERAVSDIVYIGY